MSIFGRHGDESGLDLQRSLSQVNTDIIVTVAMAIADARLTGNVEDVTMAKYWGWTFFVMTVAFSVNHATVTTPIGYASSTLGVNMGNTCNAVLYGVCMVSSLFFGPVVASSLGPKKGLTFGMTTYFIYALCFAISLFTQDCEGPGRTKCVNTPGTNLFAVLGSAIGGLGAGVLWTSQGAFFANTCQYLADARGDGDVSKVTSELSSSFAMWYVGCECVFKAAFSAFQLVGMSTEVGFIVYAIIALISTVAILFAADAPSKVQGTKPGFCDKALAAVALWSDPKIWLISGSNIAFGFSASYVAGYINASWLHNAINSATHNPDLATKLIGFLGAAICLIAAVSSKLFNFANGYFGSKVPVVALGALCFITIGVLSLITAGGGPGNWGWGICVFYVFQGVGRGVYESTNKGVFADFYAGPKATGAFANAMVQNTGASTIAFIMGAVNAASYEIWPLLISAALTVPGIFIAIGAQKKIVPDEQKA